METQGAAKKMSLVDSEPASFCTNTKPMEEEVLAPCSICVYKGLDSGSCGTCIAKAAALDRIKVAGGDSIKAARDYAERAAREICVVEAVPKKTAVAEEGKAKPVGIVRKKVMVEDGHVKSLMNGPQRAPLSPFSEDLFIKYPDLRQSVIAGAAALLLTIVQEENILRQFIKKGYAEVELEIDYGC